MGSSLPLALSLEEMAQVPWSWCPALRVLFPRPDAGMNESSHSGPFAFPLMFGSGRTGKSEKESEFPLPHVSNLLCFAQINRGTT